MGGYAWITLATNDPYCLGALVLAHSLKRVGTKHDLAVLVTPGVTSAMREKLIAAFSVVQEVNVLDSQDAANLALLERPDLGVTFTKLHCWRMTQYEKCIFVDADALVVRNCDELFEREELSAAPDVGWPDCFNSGVFVFKPSKETFASLIAFAASKGSFDGGDQGLLNQYFSDWAHKDISKHLPFIYNMCSTATYSYLPAYKQYGEEVRIVHFIGSTKPWLQYFDTQTGQVHPSPEFGHLQSLLQHWWNIFCETVHPQLSPNMTWSTLATIWHDSYSRVSITAFPFNNHVYHNPTDFTNDNIDKPVLDFSEFHDPWDNYIEIQDKSNNNHDTDGQKYRNQTDSINNEGDEFHSNSNKISGIHDIIDWIDKHDDRNNCTDYNTNDNQKNREHFQNVHSILGTKENVTPTKSQDELNYLDEYLLNLQNRSDHNHQLNENNHHDYTTQEHDQHDSRLCDTHHIQSECNYQCSDNDNKNLKDDENYHDNQHDIANTDIHTYQTPSQTCTDSESVACQSETNSFSELAHENTGIAGALAKINLGMARSPEQAAYEEHVRKQSWEHGKIDYMGRDCFDNIWTKICSTISTVIEHEPTPIQEPIIIKDNQSNTLETVSANMKIRSADTEEAVPTLQPQHDVMREIRSEQLINKGTIELKAPCCESQALETKRSNQSLPIVSPSAVVATFQISQETIQTSPQTVLASTGSILKLDIEQSSEKLDSHTATLQPQDCSKFIGQSTVIPLPLSSAITVNSMTLTDTPVAEAKLEKSPLIGQPQTTKNIVNTAVSIQVAESVLEADVKESVSEDVKPVTEEAISSISAPIQESISTVVETPLEPPAPVHSQSVEALPPAQPNGNAILDFTTNGADGNLGIDIPLVTSELSVMQVSLAVGKVMCAPTSSSSEAKLKEVIEIPCQETKEIKAKAEGTSKCNRPLDYSQMMIQLTPLGESTAQGIREAVQISNLTDPTAPSTSETIIEKVESIANMTDTVSTEAIPEDRVVKTEEEMQHEQPISTILLSTPGTPIVTEATPPTSPSLDVMVNLNEGLKTTKKVVKKIIKKPSSDGKTEGDDTEENKKFKRIVKKGPLCVIKKSTECKETPEETGENSAPEKPKKVIKVKKASKPMQNFEASTSVSDTHSSATSQTPIPPKRKVKSASAKFSTKKPDLES